MKNVSSKKARLDVIVSELVALKSEIQKDLVLVDNADNVPEDYQKLAGHLSVAFRSVERMKMVFEKS